MWLVLRDEEQRVSRDTLSALEAGGVESDVSVPYPVCDELGLAPAARVVQSRLINRLSVSRKGGCGARVRSIDRVRFRRRSGALAFPITVVRLTGEELVAAELWPDGYATAD